MLAEDVVVSVADIQGLANSDALAGLFAKLGYNTNARLAQSVSAMGITNDTLRTSIQHIKRIASDDDGISSLQVYLFELKAVTVDATRKIVGAFRDRAGDYLLVLTKDYEQIDFVLVDRYTEADIGVTQETLPGMPTPRSVRAQPRVLSIDRRKPTRVAERTLRRFSYTEADTLAQFDKLRAAYDAAYWSEQHFNNRALFSDYYLTERLPEDPAWKDAGQRAEQSSAFHTLRALYSAQERLSDLAERTLAILGFGTVAVRRRSKAVDDTTEGDTEPDYRLFSTAGGPVASDGGEGQALALALCLAYPWGRNLDGKDEERDSERGDANPGAVVVKLLDSGEAGWAIVTNGRIWRLYSATAHSRATNYYEIDLHDLLSQPASAQAEAFPYFWLFFRAAAFAPTIRREDGEERQVSFLDNLRADSERYARELEEKLKRRVFEEVFPHFASGFIAYARQHGMLPAGLEHLPDEARNQALVPYFAGTLTFLYRLLFVLYAESRDLLPVRETRAYADGSLDRLKREIAEKAGKISDLTRGAITRAYREDSATFYDQLQTLFRAIDKGNAELNVPVYNGGLFASEVDEADTSAEAEVARFLARVKIPDRQLALGLDQLARDIDEKTHDLGFIDYKSLGVRQLGSLYEGLLEFKLRVAPERMAIVRGKKTEEVVSYAEAVSQKLRILTEGTGAARHERTYAAGEVYLENDKRERKASGSYYTPDYIVKYIVAHTVGPVLTEKLEALRPKFRQAQQQLREERDKAKALIAQRLAPKNPEEEAYLKTRGAVNEAFFEMKTLDPAMGSGHFLVEAVDYITDRMAEFLTAFPWNPVVYELAKTRAEITEEMERQGVTVNTGRLTDLNLLKRHVLKRCIYGVDLNPMAVELAKVSLWLDCFTLGAPLSFLDHHMKVGNSLIGASVEEVEKSLTRNLWGSQFAGLLSATQLMRQVGDLSDVTAQEVAASRRAYRGARDALVPFKRLLDVWLSEYFGNRAARKTVDNYAQAIVDGDYSSANKEDHAAIMTALALAADKRFFHWELEFPEVFYDAYVRKENGGFDAVVGNPPYFAVSTHFSEHDVAYISKAYAHVFAGNSDVLYYFLALIPRLVRRRGLQGMIVSRYFQEAKYAEHLRTYLTGVASLIRIVDFQNHQVFGQEVNVLTSIVILEASSDNRDELVQVCRLVNDRASVSMVDLGMRYEHSDQFETFACPQPIGGEVWNFQRGQTVAIATTMRNRSIRLGEIATVVQSMQTGRNDVLAPSAKIVANYAIERELVHPIAKAGSILRYEFEDLDHELLWTDGIDIERFPRLKQYLTPFKDELADRYDIKSRRVGWWEISNPRSAELFLSNRPRILVPFIATGNKFCVDDNHRLSDGGDIRGIFFGHDSVYSPLYVCAVLNSTACEYYHLRHTKLKRGGYYEYFEGQLSALPIRRINFTTSAAERQSYLEEGKRLYTGCLAAGDASDLLAFVAACLSHDPEQSDVIHDLLAYLAEEMIRLNKEKRAEQTRYLDGLVATLHIAPNGDGNTGLDALTGKSKLADYPGDYQKGEPHLTFDGLLDILGKNRARLSVNLSDPALVERLRQEYAASLEVALPLKERLARTDRLIDQIVYKLYGLTEGEIAIVEGR